LESAVKYAVLPALALLTLMPEAVGADQAPIHWGELSGLILGHEVTVPLEDGVVVAGQVLAVRDQSLMLDVRRTSNATRYPVGAASLPRAAITEIRVVEHRGSGGKILGTVVGLLAGFIVGAEVAAHGTRSEAAGVSTFSAIAVGGTVGGYYAGKSMDVRKRVLVVLPSVNGR
jgi:hypothetical protein